MNALLNGDQIQDIYSCALTLSAEVGLKCGNQKVIAEMREKGGANCSNGRLCIPAPVMESFFEYRRKWIVDRAPHKERITIGRQWHSWELCDPVSNTPRPASYDEAVAMARLADSMGTDNSPIPVAPPGIPPALHSLECEKIALLHTKKLGGRLTVTDKRLISLMSQMNLAAGRRYVLAVEPLISPMTLNDDAMDIYFENRNNRDLDITVFGAIPMLGATVPLSFPAAPAQILAEALMQDYIFHVLSDGALSSFSLRLEPFDMRYSNIVFGSSEWCVLKQVMTELWQGLFGVMPLGGAFRTNSRRVDAQALTERTASFMWQVMLGLRHFSAVGQLCIDEVYSPVQAILDLEMAQYANRILSGLNCKWNDTDTVTEIVRQGIENGEFFSQDETVANFRSFYRLDTLSSAANLSAWRMNGSSDMLEAAWAKARAMIEKADFRIDEKAEKDVCALYEKAKQLIL